MNLKTIIVAVLILAVAAGAGYWFWQREKTNQETADQNQNQARDLVVQFGQKLQNVPLAGTNEIIIQAIKDNYTDFVSADLLNQWEQNPASAPGRLTSSPWPDRIEVSSVKKQDEGSYLVQGEVIEITSVETVSGGVADKYAVAIIVQKVNDKWRITKFEKGDYLPLQSNFSKEGNLVAADSTSTVFGFVYEEPGSPALKAGLIFTSSSACNATGTDTACSAAVQSNFKVGDRVKIEGIKNDNTINILKMTLINSQQQASLQIETLKQGTGTAVKSGDRITVHYMGKLTNGTKFDSSYDRGVPLQFTLGVGQVIAGWDRGIVGMKVGEKRRLTIPPQLAYGAGGAGGVIPPNATLIFEVELIQINN